MSSLSSSTYTLQDSYINPTTGRNKSNGINRGGEANSNAFFDYDKAWLEANLVGELEEIEALEETNASSNARNITIAMDQYIEEINIKHQVIFFFILFNFYLGR